MTSKISVSKHLLRASQVVQGLCTRVPALVGGKSNMIKSRVMVRALIGLEVLYWYIAAYAIIMRRFSETIEVKWPGLRISAGWFSTCTCGLIIIPPGRRTVAHRVFMSTSENSTNVEKSSRPWSTMMREVSAETFTTSWKYVLMIAIFVMVYYRFRYEF